jgi:two-component system sensor histidine kinase AgrC
VLPAFPLYSILNKEKPPLIASNFASTSPENLPILTFPPMNLTAFIGNIINNAFDHVQTLDVDQRLVQVDIDQDEKGYYFRIANSGTLNQETRTRIFDQGFSTKKDNQHSGLGLFIVKSLVQKHNGSIVVDNSDDMVTFTVFFPRKNTAFMPAGTVLDLHK